MDAVYGLLEADAGRVGHRGDRFILGEGNSALRGICTKIRGVWQRTGLGIAGGAGKEIKE